MKLAKLSLAAIIALSVNAFADVENVKFSGDAKLFYGTTDENPYDLFDKKNSYGQVAANIVVSADVADETEGKLRITGLSTLGLENNLVSATWAGFDGGVNSQFWVSEAWLAKKFGNTTVKVGRQTLDTPLAFSETWNIADNTFDAAVILNNDLPDTTLVAAWVGRGNGAAEGVVRGVSNGSDPFKTYGSAIDDALAKKLKIKTNLASGAYAFAAITKAIPMTTAQVWYYDVVDIAQAWWVQADVDLEDAAPGLTFGIQYANIDPTSKVDAAAGKKVDDSTAWAIKVGYAMDALKVSAAYSSTDEDGVASIANTATGLLNAQSKLYTEAWWTYGYVGRADTDTFSLTVEYSMEDVADFGAYYANADQGSKGGNVDMSELALTASKSFGNLNTTLAYIYTDADDQNVDANGNSDSYNTIQVYLTYNF